MNTGNDEPKSKQLIIYEDRKTGSLFVRATKVEPEGRRKFKLKDDTYGRAVSGNISDGELGRVVREILENCD